jgi:hypothetical protein
MKKIFLLFSLIFLMVQLSWAATYYSSNGNAPNLTASWWTTTGGTGSHPSNFTTAGDIFIIQSGHTMTTTATWSVSGTVQINGTLVASNTVTISTLTVNAGGTYQHNIDGGTIPAATWASTSTLYVTGITNTMPTSGVVGTTLSNLTWNCTGQTSTSAALAGVLSVGGNLTIQSTGSYQFRVQTSPITVTGNLIVTGGTMLVAGSAAKVMNVGGTVTVSGGTLDISAGTSSAYNGVLNVAGNFSISGAGVVTESGANTNSGIVFNGSSLQTITNSGTLSGSLNFCFNNSSGIALGSDWSITLADTIKNGNIALNGHTLTLGTSASSPGTLIWTSGFMVGSGTFTRWFGISAINIGNVAGLFPMGSGTNNRNVWIGGTPSTGGTVSVQHSDVSGTTVLPFTENSQSFTRRTNMSWSLSTANSFAGSSLSLRIQGSGIPGVNAVTDLNISASAGAAGGSYAAPGGTITNPQVNRTGLTQTTLANTFYFAAIPGSPLPVELASFISNVNGRDINLKWETQTEKNSDKFVIERTKTDANYNTLNWVTVTSVKAAVLSNSPKQYSFTDKNLQAGIYQYRLKMIDNDGAFEYSKVIETEIALPVSFELSQNYPNPFNPTTKINYSLPNDSKVTLEVYNIIGERVAQLVNEEQSAGYYVVNFGTSSNNIPSGIYIYKFTAADNTEKNFSSIKKMILLK